MEVNDEFKELEYKYNANYIKLTEFINLMGTLSIKGRSDVSSWDYYFTSVANEDEFMRFRESDRPELTIKRKTKSANNWERVEIDLPLDLQRIKLNKVETFGKVLGYSENFRIYKTCFIFWLENVNYVYYIVYNKDMVEQDRYLEVEVNKERVPVLGVEKAVEELKTAAQKLTELGLTPQHRLKKSLFEIYRK
jgi:adenylate cyclase class IV